MTETTEARLQRSTFEERHPALAGVASESFPLALVLNIDDMPMAQYKPLLDSALNTVLEYADSPLTEIVISANATTEPNRAYLTNFLEGSIGLRMLELKNRKVGIKWSGDPKRLSNQAKESIARVEKVTLPDSNLRLSISFGRSDYKYLRVVSVNPEVVEKTNPASGEVHKATVFTNAGIDSAVLASLRQPVAA